MWPLCDPNWNCQRTEHNVVPTEQWCHQKSHKQFSSLSHFLEKPKSTTHHLQEAHRRRNTTPNAVTENSPEGEELRLMNSSNCWVILSLFCKGGAESKKAFTSASRVSPGTSNPFVASIKNQNFLRSEVSYKKHVTSSIAHKPTHEGISFIKHSPLSKNLKLSKIK